MKPANGEKPPVLESPVIQPIENLYTMKPAKGGLVLWKVERITIQGGKVINREFVSERDAWDYALGRLIIWLEKEAEGR